MRIYLTNLASDVTGYKLALIDERNPAATSTPATAVTTLVAGSHSLTAGGTTFSATLTAGGTVAKWITKPLKNAITVPAVPQHVNLWAKRGSAAGHASFDFHTKRYTTSDQGDVMALVTTSHADMGFRLNAMISSTTGQLRAFAGAAASSTAFSAGDRIIIKPAAINAWKTSTAGVTMSAGTLTLDFDGSVDGADGDTWIEIPVGGTTALAGAVTVRQPVATNTSVTFAGEGKAFYQNLIDGIDAAVASGKFTKDSSVNAFYNELIAERGNQ